MSKTTNTFAAFLVASSLVTGAFAQEGQRLAGAKVVDYSHYTNLPNFIKLNANQQMAKESFVNWAVYAFNVPNTSTFKPYETFSDEYGFTHTRYKQFVNGIPVEGSQVIAHGKEGKVQMVNGDYFQNFSSTASASLSEKDALAYALKKVNARRYMWENKEFENMKKQISNNPAFTFYPKGELVYAHKTKADFSAENMRLAYKFNIYSEVPLSRANICVDATTGEILAVEELIHTADVVGTGVTKYSGTVPMTCDNTTGPFRLREVGRGNGIETYNLNNGTNYGSAVDFTNGSSTWNLAGNNQAASDAHWGAEMTYDYYKNVHSRNSIDGAGFKLLSYVHYSTNYVNAFWNGSEMTYGDGNGTSFTIMTALDVCGHEITHGLTNFTAGLNGGGTGEPDALNEGFSDIFGTTIEFYARPSQHDWLMGADITPGGIRDMSNPKNLGQPNCYTGTNWDLAGEPHNNNGPSIYWYYLLCQGGSATNDLGNAYSVTGQTMAKARLIAFRGLTVYFTSSTTYANARTYTEQAATDIYGSCSAELTATSNAWYAVGVGGVPTSGAPSAAFSTGTISTCTMPVTVNFTNTSAGAQSYSWNFGDGGTSITASPSHTYTLAGTYTVTLVATGCGGGSTNTTTQVITIGGAATLPLVEGFESSATIPSGWSLYNPDADAAWEINTTVAKTGVHCMGFNNCSGDGNTDMTGRVDRAYTKNYNFSGLASAQLTFDVAYAVLTYSGTAYSDQLKVNVSTNCGTTWTTLYTKAGATLATAPGYTVPQPCWAPTAAQWRNDNVNLSSVLGQPNVMIAFENTSAWGTWIYLDNINITGITGIASANPAAEGMMIYPNPAHNNITVQAEQNITSIQVIDMLGKSVIRQQPSGEKTVLVDISSLPAGIYFVKVNAGEAQKLIKLVKE